ncbi:TSC22 domain family protein 4-like isoform X2 [Mizuhopecten yessoensis]|uniref:TSC22 domain family protein 3 n=1 Tax=Mizuhopecten yessoensis TaxID=6573 RepID=A0A210QGN0_MIZYE|nr:TSC22 domain family protein 4-like isoform X2 [Mizuhopecten yessoensis]OWF47898.1 TSC22 domain family protein 3 [Mizuhopecten yessoensis]
MAAHPKFDKMAVTVDNSSSNSSVYDTNTKEDLDHRPSMGNMKSLTDGMHKKKSTFKITSVTKNIQRPPIGGDPPNDADGDSMDDLDETVESHTEDLSSEILDSSKYTDLGDQNTPLEDFTQTFGQDSEVIISNTGGKEVTTKEKSDVHSSTTTRFKVVKIETKEPFRRGRWLCHDLLDTPVTEKSETKVVRDSTTDDQANSGNSSASSSIHYVPGVDDPAKNPLAVTGLQNQGTDGFVIQSDNQSDKFQSKPQPGMVPTSQDGTHSYNQPNPNVSQIPTSLPTHPSQNYQGIVVNAGAGSPGQTRQNIPQTGPVTGHGGSVPPGHVQKPMQVQTPVADNANPSSQHSSMPVTTGTSQIPNSITGQMPPTLNDQTKLPQPGGTGLGPVPSGQSQINQSTVDSSSNPASAKDTAHWNESDGGEVQTLNFNIAASRFNNDQTGLDSRLTHQLKPVTGPSHFSDFSAPILTPLAVAEAVGGMSSPTKADESGSSTVAIDNKIEQAMDLVKSHLMYAVREEVEVLKEQIQELVEKNNQLEQENSILRASASTETLSKLQVPRQSQPPSSSS